MLYNFLECFIVKVRENRLLAEVLNSAMPFGDAAVRWLVRIPRCVITEGDRPLYYNGKCRCIIMGSSHCVTMGASRCITTGIVLEWKVPIVIEVEFPIVLQWEVLIVKEWTLPLY